MNSFSTILIIILIIIIFFPFPVKIIFKYKTDTKPEIFFYNIKIKAKKKKPQKKDTKLIKKLYTVIKNSKLKFSIKLNINFTYDLEDAAAVGIIYGCLWAFYSLIYKVLSLFFNVKKFNLNIVPNFNNKKFFNLNINCIFFISLAKVIYIGFGILKQNYKLKKLNTSKT